MMKIRFAVIGTSKITEKFLQAASCCDDFLLYAVYSREKSRAEAFAKKHGAVKCYDNLDMLAADGAIDAVYIASPNHMHHSQAIKLMNAGKHVLCEKAMASNEREVADMVKVSEKKSVVLMEAMRSVYDPGFEKIRENLFKIGKIRRVTFRYCQYSSRYDNFKKGQQQNIFDRNCSAGSLMDIGVYCVYPMVCLFGNPQKITSSSVLLSGGIDGMGTITATYEDMIAELIYSKITQSSLPSEIQGEDGNLLIWNITDPRRLEIQHRSGDHEIIDVPGSKNNMQYEIQKFIQVVQGKDDVKEYLRISQSVMKIMDEARRQSGIEFPADK